MMVDRDRVYTVPRATRETGAPRDMLYAAIADRSLPAVTRGRVHYFSGAALIAFLEHLGERAAS